MAVFSRMQDRVVIITGAASGIGRAACELFVAEGARVVAVDRPESGIEALFAETSKVVVLARSVTDAHTPALAVEMALEQFGGLDILFNNAGVAPVSPVVTMPDAMWHDTFEVNVNAVFRLCRAAIPHLIERARRNGRARIINTASITAQFSDSNIAAYAASKHALAGLTKTLAHELSRHGVTANYIMPGAITTGMTGWLFDQPQIRHAWENAAPAKRLGTPLDIARAALLLASDEADFITGHGLVVDGGLSLRAGPAMPE